MVDGVGGELEEWLGVAVVALAGFVDAEIRLPPAASSPLIGVDGGAKTLELVLAVGVGGPTAANMDGSCCCCWAGDGDPGNAICSRFI